MPDTDPRADEELVRACVAGDRGAFDRLVARHQRQIYRLCYRFVGNHEDATELAQDAFVRAYRALPKFERTAKFTTWLHRISVNVCLNRLALKRPQHEPLRGIETATAAGEGAESALLREERARRVRAAIARLPTKQRATLILRAYHELPHEEIAGILDSSAGAVKANFFHALANLKKLLDE
ncbi:MAG TPA: sigma-70 family RNA polymerase sigma factor [Vicinamibacterales bacterium]|nr:sigma-70 family RNA polymerase sigma factor [Vicinamibacterales bacterium]